MEASYKRESESLESYAKVMKDTAETNQQDADKFLNKLIEKTEITRM